MKKKDIVLGLLIVLAAILGVSLLMRPKALANMSNNYSEPATVTSDISFSGEAGDRIKFLLSSRIEGGELDIILYNSAGEEVYQLDRAKELKTFFVLSDTDTYTLTAECSDFVGKYKVEVYKAD